MGDWKVRNISKISKDLGKAMNFSEEGFYTVKRIDTGYFEGI